MSTKTVPWPDWPPCTLTLISVTQKHGKRTTTTFEVQSRRVASARQRQTRIREGKKGDGGFFFADIINKSSGSENIRKRGLFPVTLDFSRFWKCNLINSHWQKSRVRQLCCCMYSGWEQNGWADEDQNQPNNNLKIDELDTFASDWSWIIPAGYYAVV